MLRTITFYKFNYIWVVMDSGIVNENYTSRAGMWCCEWELRKCTAYMNKKKQRHIAEENECKPHRPAEIWWKDLVWMTLWRCPSQWFPRPAQVQQALRSATSGRRADGLRPLIPLLIYPINACRSYHLSRLHQLARDSWQDIGQCDIWSPLDVWGPVPRPSFRLASYSGQPVQVHDELLP